MVNYLHLLQNNSDFAKLWLAQVISLLGDWFNTIVLSALVAEYSGGSGLAISIFLLARFLPPLVVSPFTGVLVDRFDRQRLLILSDILRAGTVLLLLPVITLGPGGLWLIYLLTTIQFGLSGLFEPGRNAILPNLVAHEDLVSANTLSSVTWSVMLAIGAVIGGVVAGSIGIAGALTIDALTFVLSAWLITQIRSYHLQPVEANISSDGSELSKRGFREGLRYVRSEPGIAATLLVKLGQSLGNVDALMIVYATELFYFINSDGSHNVSTPLSYMFAAFGVGAVIGPFLLNRFHSGSVHMLRRYIIIGFIWITLGWLVFGKADTLVLVLLALVIRAMGGSVNWTYSSVIIQKCTPDIYLGRMFSLDMAGFQFASAISILATGLLVDWLGSESVRQIVLGMAVISIVPLMFWGLAVLYLEKHQTATAACD